MYCITLQFVYNHVYVLHIISYNNVYVLQFVYNPLLKAEDYTQSVEENYIKGNEDKT